MAAYGSGVVVDVRESQQPGRNFPVFLIETDSDIEGFLMCMDWPKGQEGDPLDLMGKGVRFDLRQIKKGQVPNPWFFEDGTGIGRATMMVIPGEAVSAPDALQ